MNKLLRFLLPLLISLPAWAEQATAELPEVDPVSSAYLLKLTGGLVLIVIVIFGLAWLMKKMQLTQHANNGLIQIVSAISVGQRDRIALIQVGEEQILVGLTPGRIQKLHALNRPVDADVSTAASNAAPFAEKFKQLLERGDNHAS